VQVSETTGAKSGAVDGKNDSLELNNVVEAWPTLSPDIRAAINAIVLTAQTGDCQT